MRTIARTVARNRHAARRMMSLRQVPQVVGVEPHTAVVGVAGFAGGMTLAMNSTPASAADQTTAEALKSISGALVGMKASLERIEKNLGCSLPDGWWLNWGKIDESNPNNTEDFKYRVYDARPPMVHTSQGGKHKSLMCKHLTDELFEKLKNKTTSKGYTLSHAPRLAS